MSDDITKMILFGEDILVEDLAGFSLSNFVTLQDVGIEKEDIKEKGAKIVVKKKLGGQKEDGEFARPISKIKRPETIDSNQLFIKKKEPQEKDLNLRLICVSEGEKIYKLSDLFIPKDERIIKKIEKYNNKVMVISERLKHEKEQESQLQFPKKEVSDAEEMKHLVRKAKRNQKFTKINVTYNEKFFLENINTDKLAVSAIQDNSGINITNTILGGNMAESGITSLELTGNIHDLKIIEIPEDKKINDNIVESNLLNSLFYLRTKIKEDQKNGIIEEETDAETEFKPLSIIEEKNLLPEKIKENQKSEGSEMMDVVDIIEINKTIRENAEKFNESILNNTNPNANHSFVFNDTFVGAAGGIPNINIFENPDFKLFSLNKSNLFKDINLGSDKNRLEKGENMELVPNINKVEPQNDVSMKDLTIYNNSVLKNQSQIPIPFFKQEKENIQISDLYDNIKRKRHRAQGYYNENMLNGSFMGCLLLNDENVTNAYKEISKRIFDMNDYNMNFEVLKTENIQKKDQAQTQLREINLTTNGGMPSGEDFFTNLINQKLVSATGSQQPVLKIGKAKGNLLTHAKCAYNLNYNKINFTYDDLKDFHRPNFPKVLLKDKKKRNFSILISDNFNISAGTKNKRWGCTILTRNYLKKKEKKRISKNIQYMNAYEIFKDRYKLSLVDGKYCLFEHIDEHPLFLSNFGMASKLKKFIYTPKLLNVNVSNSATKLTETELKTYNIIGPYGIQIPLQPNQKLPLIGQIDINELKGLSVVDNKMYRAPVFYEKIKNPVMLENRSSKNINSTNINQQGKKYFNFLITFKKSKNGKEGFYIRELDHHYTVAQEEPKIEVYPPQSRQYLNFFKNKIKTYTYKLYDEIGYKAGINFKVFTNLFPNATEQILKKNFREMKIEIDKNICYFTKLPNEDNQMLITPENICQFESCQFGIYKLREVGIKNLTNPDKISYATNKFINQTPDLKQQFLAKVIEEELLTTPWNITQNFLQAKQIKGMLAIKGIGDPSNGQGGYSFLKMPVKTYNDNKTLKEEIDQLKIMNKNIKTVTGTDADLRKLSKEDIKLKLIQLGEDEEYINKLSRWERVSLLRYKSSKAAELGYEGDITKYARGTRMNSKVQRDAYQKNINEVFKKQINYITTESALATTGNYSDESSEEEEEKNNLASQELPLNEHEDKKKGLGFMRNEIYTTSNKKKKKTENRRVGIVNDNRKIDDGKIIKVYSKNQNQNYAVDDASTKIKFDMKNVDVEYLRRKQKSSQSFDNVYEYEMDKASTLISRKRRDTPEKMFNELIEDIIDTCIKFDLTKIFHQPVKKKEYQDYYEIVKNPIDLGSMKNKTKRNEYLTVSQFTADLDLMVYNSSIYNGDTHDVTIQANKIKDLALSKIQDNQSKFNELETKINEKNSSEIIQI